MPNNLDTVAGELSRLSGKKPEADAYARSAFNRYYYSTFLELREMFIVLDEKWAKTPHGTYPGHLKGAMLRKLKKRASTLRDVRDFDNAKIFESACHGIPELAKIMEKGYDLRVIADYQPEVEINFSNKTDFTLNDIAISEAKSWPDRARKLSKIIISAWRDTQ